jgi:hypothetical protein
MARRTIRQRQSKETESDDSSITEL